MAKWLTIPRLGSPRIDAALVERVRKAKAAGATDAFYTTGEDGRKYLITRMSDAGLYQKMMAAKGLPVRVGAV